MATFTEARLADELVLTLFRKRKGGELEFGVKVEAATLAEDGTAIRSLSADLWQSLSAEERLQVQSLISLAESQIKSIAQMPS